MVMFIIRMLLIFNLSSNFIRYGFWCLGWDFEFNCTISVPPILTLIFYS